MLKSNERRDRNMYCVIVGDIIKSREIDIETREKIKLGAKKIFDRINTEYISSLIAPFGMVRGDAFEGVLLTQYYAPKIIQEIIKAFYHIGKTLVRISTVTGKLTTIDNDRNENDGPAFYNALADLNVMKERNSNHWLQISINTNSIAQPIIDSQLKLLIALTEGWTNKQHEIVWKTEEYHKNPKRKNIVGKVLGIKTSVINKQLKAANYEAYRLAWESFENYLIAINEDMIVEKSEQLKSYLAYYNVALRRYKQNNYNEAILLLNKSLDIAKDLSGDHLQLFPIYNLLSETYTKISDYDKALETICKSLQLQDKLPKARMQYIEALKIQSKIYYYKNNYNKARRIIDEALKIARNFLDEEHPYILRINDEITLINKNFINEQDFVDYKR